MTCACTYENDRVTGLCGAHAQAYREYHEHEIKSLQCQAHGPRDHRDLRCIKWKGHEGDHSNGQLRWEPA